MPDKILKTIKPREYQQKIFETCKDKNCLVVLPTGTGKTLVALMLSIARLRLHPECKILFLAPTRPLAEQHFAYFQKYLPELFATKELFTGKIVAEKRKKLWQNAEIIFSTPQCVTNDLKKGLYDLKEVSLLIEDECVIGDTKIKLSSGTTKPIKDIWKNFKSNPKVYVESLSESGNQESRRILKVHRIKSKKKMLKIKVKSKEVTLTEDHKIMLKRGLNYVWTEAKNIKEGDEIATERMGEKDYKDKTIINKKQIKNESAINKRLDKMGLLPLKYSNPRLKVIARLFGFILGDGWFTKIKEEPKILGFSGQVEDLKKVQNDLDILNAKFPRIASRSTSSIILTAMNKETFVSGNTNSFNVTDSALAKLFKVLKMPYGDKTINSFLLPCWLMESPKHIKKEFLASLMGCEGDIPKFKKNLRSPYAIRFRFNKLKSLKKNALEYADQIKELFNQFEVKSTIQIKKGNLRKNKQETIQVQITIGNSNKNIYNFLKSIGYEYNHKKAKEANKILNYLKYKEDELNERDFFYKQILKLKKKGCTSHKAIQITSKQFKVKPTRIWSLGYCNKATHCSWLLESYDTWSEKNKPSPKVKWEKVRKIKGVAKERYVYDLTIEKNHNYIGNGIIIHNCHRCLKNYDYTYVAEKYKQEAENQRILGLTASPGADKATIKKISKNLGIEAIEIRTRESDDVKEYLQELKFDTIKLDFPEELQKIKELLQGIHDKKIQELKNRKLLFGFPTKKNILDLQRKIMKMISTGNRHFNTFSGASACAQVIKLQYCLELLETQTLSALARYFQDIFEQAKQGKTKAVQQLIKQPQFNQAYIKTQELIARKIENPKLLVLKDIIEEEFKKSKIKRIIVFSQYRETVTKITRTLNEIPGVNAMVFVGQLKKGETGLSQREQKQVIEDFTLGKVNILCSTSVHPDEYIVLKNKNRVILKKIGEFIDSFIEKDEEKTVSKKIFEWETLTSDGKNTLFKPISHIHKHPTQNNVINIKSGSGFDCKITENHSLFSFKKENQFIPAIPKQNKFIALSIKCPNTKKSKKIDVLKEIKNSCSKKSLQKLFGSLNGLTQAKIRTLKTNHDVLSKLRRKERSIIDISKLTKRDYSTVADCLKRLKEQGFINQKRVKKHYKNISKISKKGLEYLGFLNWFYKNVKYRKGKYRFSISNSVLNNKEFNKFFEQKINIAYGKTNFPRFIEMNEELAKFLGFYVSEGSTRKTKYTSEVFLAARNKKMQKLMRDSIKKGLKLKTRTNWSGITIDSQIAYYLIKEVFKAGIGAYNKEVPEIIFTSPDKIKWEFLRAYFLGDGYLGKDKIVLTTVSRKLVTGIILLLRMLGIQKISIFKQKNIYRINIAESLPFAKIKSKNEKRRHAYYSLIPTALRSEEAFDRYKNYYLPSASSIKCRKNGKWKTDICFDYIKKIEEIEKPKYVYDLSVKDTENFIGGTGLFCLHNSIGEEGLDIPEVSAVIFYEPIPSAIRQIQRRGRTARLKPGKLIILMIKGTRDEAYYWSAFNKEKKMHKALDSIKEELENNRKIEPEIEEKQQNLLDLN